MSHDERPSVSPGRHHSSHSTRPPVSVTADRHRREESVRRRSEEQLKAAKLPSRQEAHARQKEEKERLMQADPRARVRAR
jgi:hypothetical protein